ncbi:MAG: NAD(P)H-dependent oxidoreductase [Pseudomonadota bacterium]
MTKPTIAFLNGSLRKDSFHGRLGKAIIAASAERLSFVTPSLELPLYDSDLDKEPLPAWTEFRDAVRNVDGVLFGSPEYNRSITGALKNAIDVGSRPYGKSVFSKKPAAIFSGSPGMTGGFGSNHHLRQCCVFLDMPVMQQPEAYWGLLNDDKVGADGSINDEKLAGFVTAFATAFADWVDLIAQGRARLADDPAHQ